MLGWILAALGATYLVASNNELKEENTRLRDENNQIKLTFYNQQTLLHDYDIVNKYAKSIGYRGAVDFFYDLAEYHDGRLAHFARFLNKVKHIRNDIAHNGNIYIIDENFLRKLEACKGVCAEHQRLPSGCRLRLE